MTLPWRRRLRLQHHDELVDADLEDHIHHVKVRVGHDGSIVTSVQGEALRLPWSLCPESLSLLDELVGSEIGTLPRVADARQHCTHLLDLGRMAIAAAGGPEGERVVEITVSAWETRSPVVEVVGGDDSAEVALFVKRATWMAASRGIDLDALDTLDQSGVGPGACYSSQPQRITIARRNRGSSLKELI